MALAGLVVATVIVTLVVGVAPGLEAAPATRQQWVSTYRGPRKLGAQAYATAVSPDGSKVFISGSTATTEGGGDYLTAADDSATGALLWATRYSGIGGLEGGVALSIAVSPGGSSVFITGFSPGLHGDIDFATVAYDTATGAERWASRFDDAHHGIDDAYAVAVSPDGSTVFVTGASDGRNGALDYTTVAYSATTGAERWTARYNGPGNDADVAQRVVVAPGGSRVYVTGVSEGAGQNQDYATVAYDAATGAQLWVGRYNGPGDSVDWAQSLAVSPGGARVFVTGYSFGRSSAEDYATVAYAAATGRQLWVARYDGPAHRSDVATAVGVSPGGQRVYVTGGSFRTATDRDFTTVAYDAGSGAARWVARTDSPLGGDDGADALAVGPDGTSVFVTGTSTGFTGYDYDWATVAYRATDGQLLWDERYSTKGNLDDVPLACAAGPDGSMLFVTGFSTAQSGTEGMTTVAYRAIPE